MKYGWDDVFHGKYPNQQGAAVPGAANKKVDLSCSLFAHFETFGMGLPA